MAAKKKQFKFSPWDSCCTFAGESYIDGNGMSRKEVYDTMGESIRFTESWHGLGYRARDLYQVCRLQIMGKRKPRNDYESESYPQFQGAEVFYLPFNEVLRYGNYTESQKKNFSADMDELEDFGFIKILSKGRGHVKSIYALDTRFKYMTREQVQELKARRKSKKK